MRKQFKLMAATALMTAVMSSTAFAAGWQQNDTGWWYGTNDANTEWYADGWHWIDGNQDGTAECYYFDGSGYMLAGTVTPDGYRVNADGAWEENGAVQTKAAAAQQQEQQQAQPEENNGVDPMSTNRAVAGTIDYNALNGSYKKDPAMGEAVLYTHRAPDSFTISNASEKSMDVVFEGGSYPGNGTMVSEDGVNYKIVVSYANSSMEDIAWLALLDSGKFYYEHSVPSVGYHYAFFAK